MKSMELLDLIAKVKTDEARAKLENQLVTDVIQTKVGVPFHYPVDFEDDGAPMWLERGTRILLVIRGPLELAIKTLIKQRTRVIDYHCTIRHPGTYDVCAYLNLPGQRKVEIIPLQTAIFVAHVH